MSIRSSPIATQANAPERSLTTSIKAETYKAFERIAHSHGLSKSALLREMVERTVHDAHLRSLWDEMWSGGKGWP